ncbi:kinase-like domain-containing protein [Tanacetum coccineum]
MIDMVQRNWLEGTSSNIINSRINVDSSSMTKFVEIGLLCLQSEPADRPTMEEIIDMLLDNLSLTLSVLEMRERMMIRKRSKCINHIPVVDDYDTSAVEAFISELCPR